MNKSIAIKIHLILLMIVLGTLFYMFLIYKNIKLIENDVDLLKAQMNTVLPPDVKNMQEKLREMINKDNMEDNEIVITKEHTFVDLTEGNDIKEDIQENVIEDIQEIESLEDDNESVKTQDIKKIFTESEIEPLEEEIEIPEKENTPEHPFKSMTVSELSNQKYDDLKSFLKDHGESVKGTKVELAKKILEILNSK